MDLLVRLEPQDCRTTFQATFVTEYSTVLAVTRLSNQTNPLLSVFSDQILEVASIGDDYEEFICKDFSPDLQGPACLSAKEFFEGNPRKWPLFTFLTDSSQILVTDRIQSNGLASTCYLQRGKRREGGSLPSGKAII